jgi:transcriptional regulatory protein GAL4
MTEYSALIWQSTFCVATNSIYNHIISNPPPTTEELMEMDQEIERWHATVPEWMTATATPDMFTDTPWLHFSAHKLFWRYANLRIILTRRPFREQALKGVSEEPTSEEVLNEALSAVCLDCAIKTIYDIKGFFLGEPLNRLKIWYGL